MDDWPLWSLNKPWQALPSIFARFCCEEQPVPLDQALQKPLQIGHISNRPVNHPCDSYTKLVCELLIAQKWLVIHHDYLQYQFSGVFTILPHHINRASHSGRREWKKQCLCTQTFSDLPFLSQRSSHGLVVRDPMTRHDFQVHRKVRSSASWF